MEVMVETVDVLLAVSSVCMLLLAIFAGWAWNSRVSYVRAATAYREARDRLYGECTDLRQKLAGAEGVARAAEERVKAGKAKLEDVQMAYSQARQELDKIAAGYMPDYRGRTYANSAYDVSVSSHRDMLHYETIIALTVRPKRDFAVRLVPPHDMRDQSTEWPEFVKAAAREIGRQLYGLTVEDWATEAERAIVEHWLRNKKVVR